jgi:hypothetical protein
MYTQGELIRLDAHKAALRRRIAHHRVACAVVASRLLQPVVWLDRMLVLWRRFAPFAPLAALPLSLLLRRTPTPRTGLITRLLRWSPLLLGTVRGLIAARAPAVRR